MSDDEPVLRVFVGGQEEGALLEEVLDLWAGG